MVIIWCRFIPKEGDIQRIENADDRFEAAAPDEVKTEVKYGLNIMREAAPGVEVEVKEEHIINGRTGQASSSPLKSF